MIRTLAIFIALILMSKLSFSQETYPKTLLIGKDTLIVLKPKQVREINVSYEYRRFLEAENVIINKTLTQYVALSNKKDSIILLKAKTEEELRADIANIKAQYEKLSEENNKININLTKIKKSRKTWLISGIGVGVLTVLIIQ
jgi:chromosome segregation ATPase